MHIFYLRSLQGLITPEKASRNYFWVFSTSAYFVTINLLCISRFSHFSETIIARCSSKKLANLIRLQIQVLCTLTTFPKSTPHTQPFQETLKQMLKHPQRPLSGKTKAESYCWKSQPYSRVSNSTIYLSGKGTDHRITVVTFVKHQILYTVSPASASKPLSKAYF